MKNFLFITAAIMILSINTVKAQWSITGNASTNPPTNFLGTTDSKDLVFKTYSFERMRIYSTGAVRINSLTPNKLVLTDDNKSLISGNVNLTTMVAGILPVANGGTGASTLTGVLVGNGTNAMTGIVGTENNLLRWQNGTISNNSRIYDDGINVGIGINSPQNNLQIHNYATEKTVVGVTVLQLTNNSSGIAASDGVQLRMGAVGFYNNAYLWNAEPGDLTFATNNLKRMTIGSDGKVIVGTNFLTTSALLQVDGNSVITGNLGLGIMEPTEKLDIDGSLKLSSRELYEAGNGTIIFNGTSFLGRINNSWVSLSTIGENFWTMGTNGIYTNNYNVGVNTNPLTSMHVKNINSTVSTTIRLEKASGTLEPVITDLINTGSNFIIKYQDKDIFTSNATTSTLSNQLKIDRPNTTNPDILITKQGEDFLPSFRMEHIYEDGNGDLNSHAFEINFNSSQALIFQKKYNGIISDIISFNAGRIDVPSTTVTRIDGNVGLGCEPNSGSVLTVKGNISLCNNDSPATIKLYGDGKIWVKSDIKVQEVNDWGDFVFDPAYKLKSLKEVEAYINTNKHLPGLPSANDVKENGINLGEMTNTLTQKIEEMTLYMIEMNKTLEQLKKENEQLRQDNANMKQEIEKITK